MSTMARASLKVRAKLWPTAVFRLWAGALWAPSRADEPGTIGCAIWSRSPRLVAQQLPLIANPNLLQDQPQEPKAAAAEESAQPPQAQEAEAAPEAEKAEATTEGEQTAKEAVVECEEGAAQSVVCCGFYS